MASIRISEKDFETLASAATDARDAGDMELATALDKLARKVNASLTRAQGERKVVRMLGIEPKPFTWRDVPSVL